MKKSEVQELLDTISNARIGYLEALEALAEFALSHAEDDPIEFTNIYEGREVSRNWWQVADNGVVLYPYMFKVCNSNRPSYIVVIHAEGINTAVRFVVSRWDNYTYLRNI